MAVTKVVEVIGRAQTILQDNTGTRWPRIELQNWLNDAYKEIVLVRPDANTQSSTINLTTGTRQSIAVSPAGSLRLIDVVRNMAATSQKRSIRLIQRKILDEQIADWHAAPSSVDIQHYVFDERVPKEFLVYPPASSQAQVEILYSSVPTPHALTEVQLSSSAITDVIKLDDIYANAMLDYILYRAYSKDVDYAGNDGRAAASMSAFNSSLGIKTQVDATSNPSKATA